MNTQLPTVCIGGDIQIDQLIASSYEPAAETTGKAIGVSQILGGIFQDISAAKNMQRLILAKAGPPCSAAEGQAHGLWLVMFAMSQEGEGLSRMGDGRKPRREALCPRSRESYSVHVPNGVMHVTGVCIPRIKENALKQVGTCITTSPFSHLSSVIHQQQQGRQ